MTVALDVDYKNVVAIPRAVENAELRDEVVGAVVVNVDANFVIPEEERHKDQVFPRFAKFKEIVEVAQANNSLVSAGDIPEGAKDSRPFRRPDFGEEWKMLRRAWSLHRRGRGDISSTKVSEGSEMFYANDPLNDINDWVWRFTLTLSQPAYEQHFISVFEFVREQVQKPTYQRLSSYYSTHIRLARLNKLPEIFDEYFSNFDDFGQVHFQVARGIDEKAGESASTVNFARTRMFYGNAFETLGSSVDFLAYMQNIASGREFDEFENLTQEQYLRLDKSSRFGPLENCKPCFELFVERDNKLRNASHHGSMVFEPKTQAVTFKTGKGGVGQAQELSYVTYLSKCSRIFLQLVTLLRVEILARHITDESIPV